MNQASIEPLSSETWEWDKWKQELNHLDESNTPLRINVCHAGVHVYHGDLLLHTFMGIGAVLGVCISHKGEWLVVVAHDTVETTLYLYEMKTMTLSWEECLHVHEVWWFVERPFDLQFSPDDSKILVMHNEDPMALDSVTFCVVFHTMDGSAFLNPTHRDSSNLAQKAFFGQDLLLAPGFCLQPGNVDFCVVNLEKMGGNGELERGIYVNIESDIIGKVVRLHGWRADTNKVVIICVKTKEIYLHIYDGGDGQDSVDLVESYEVNAEEEVINSGVSLDGTLLALMVESEGEGYWLLVFRVGDLELGDQMLISDEYTMYLQTMSDQPLIVDTTNNTVTVYCRDSILMIYLEDNRVERRLFQTPCIAFSDGDNFFSQNLKKEKTLSLMMAFHERLGTKSMLGCVDADVVRRMIIPETYGLR
ncbi:hypothetical protein T484DRAFT_1757350 [Baffinella frigidus]|nr:hypothetical protein T484DRAFT_1757350 [Cryptophyta sp. CCMP2293]